MLRALIVPALAIASFLPAASAAEGYTPVTPAVYHPGLDHQTAVVQADYHYSHRRARYARRHRRHKAVKRIGLGAAGGAAVGALAGGGKGAAIGAAAGAGAGALYNKHENDKGR
ncbi:MAG TPA: YMGG-like glycine zipper-containing protein [Bryobacteraceae bacterium]|nr:YMGG-like glycine zipper-containing protein [Bryobacteraceae bacterium]